MGSKSRSIQPPQIPTRNQKMGKIKKNENKHLAQILHSNLWKIEKEHKNAKKNNAFVCLPPLPWSGASPPLLSLLSWKGHTSVWMARFHHNCGSGSQKARKRRARICCKPSPRAMICNPSEPHASSMICRIYGRGIKGYLPWIWEERVGNVKKN